MLIKSTLAHRVPWIGDKYGHPLLPTLEYTAMERILEIIGGLAVCYIAVSIAVYWWARN
jgi:hypothetical protein